MLIRFFLMLRAAGVPVTITEFLALLEGLAQARADRGTVPSVNLSAIDQFYFVARTILMKDETPLRPLRPRLCRAFRGAEIALEAILEAGVPADWLEKTSSCN